MKGGVGTNGIPLPEEVLRCMIDPDGSVFAGLVVM
jgi:hypothetical protein